MKIFNVITIARQVDGEYVFVKVEKSFLDQKRASDYANGLARKYAENDVHYTRELYKFFKKSNYTE